MSQHFQHDVLVIGSGAAGLTLALTLPPHLRIAVLSKGSLDNGSTYWAQGGVAAVLDDADTVESHVEDTLNAGGGLCREDAVRFTVEHSREAIQWLIDQGVPFTRDDETAREDGGFEFHLTREGGHSHRRIIHAADATGAAIFNTLLAAEKFRATQTAGNLSGTGRLPIIGLRQVLGRCGHVVGVGEIRVAGDLAEDAGATLRTSGALTVSDADAGQAVFVAQAATAGARSSPPALRRTWPRTRRAGPASISWRRFGGRLSVATRYAVSRPAWTTGTHRSTTSTPMPPVGCTPS